MIKKQLQTPRGMRDILPEEQKYWHFLENNFERVVKSAGFSRINTPIIEKASLFEHPIGEETDIIQKEMYAVKRKSDISEKDEKEDKEELVLRPESTASIVRAYIEHGMSNLPQPVHLYSMGSMFRYERPQYGRTREFSQFSLEVIGELDPILDAQIISLATRIIHRSRIRDFSVQINSIGCKKCRIKYTKKLQEAYAPILKKLCPDCQKRYHQNPLRLLDCKEPACQEYKSHAPQIIDYLDEEDQNHFRQVLEYLDELEIPYELNTYLVRGLDYYSRTVFEIWSQDSDLKDNAQAAFGAGGRYDGLVESLGGRPTPAIGFALGANRIVPVRDVPDIFVIQLGELAKKKSLRIIEELREEGFRVVSALGKESIKSQMRLADKLKSPLALILGHKEVLDGTIIIKDMSGGMQEVVSLDNLVDEIKKRLPRESF